MSQFDLMATVVSVLPIGIGFFYIEKKWVPEFMIILSLFLLFAMYGFHMVAQ